MLNQARQVEVDVKSSKAREGTDVCCSRLSFFRGEELMGRMEEGEVDNSKWRKTEEGRH